MRRISRRTAVVAGALALSAATTACGSSPPTQPSAAPVAIKTFMFGPDPVRVKAGTTVTWRNQDDILHTVTSGKRNRPTRRFDAKLRLGGEFAHSFDRAGTFPYVCTIHMGMDGVVIVE